MAKKSRVSFRDGKGRFAGKSSKGVRVYRGRKRLTGKTRTQELKNARTAKPRGRLDRGFPKGYTSPFRAFITPVSRARAPERTFALVEITSRRKYEGIAYRNWIPFDLGFNSPVSARALSSRDVERQFKLSNLKGKNDLTQIFGLFMLKPEEARRKALTPRLLALIKHRAKYGNEHTKGLPKRPTKKKR